jgi:hypothetical protein
MSVMGLVIKVSKDEMCNASGTAGILTLCEGSFEQSDSIELMPLAGKLIDVLQMLKEQRIEHIEYELANDET